MGSNDKLSKLINTEERKQRSQLSTQQPEHISNQQTVAHSIPRHNLLMESSAQRTVTRRKPFAGGTLHCPGSSSAVVKSLT